MNTSDFKLDFVGIGFPRSGTTWLSHNLMKNPNLDLSKYKEMHYFLTNESEIFKDNPNFKKLRPQKIDDYISKFKNNGLPRGEFSVHYVFDKVSLMEMKKRFPGIKVFLCIRNPIDYLESAYNFVKSSHVGHELSGSMLDDIKSANSSEMHSLQRAYFYKYVRDAIDIFGDRLKIIKMRDIVKNPREVLVGAYEFLNVVYDPNHFELESVNRSLEPRNTLALKGVHFIRDIIMKTPFRNALFTFISKENIVQDIFNKTFKRQRTSKSKLTSYERSELEKLLFDDTKKLNSLVGEI